jgi:hypothetical protein
MTLPTSLSFLEVSAILLDMARDQKAILQRHLDPTMSLIDTVKTRKPVQSFETFNAYDIHSQRTLC